MRRLLILCGMLVGASGLVISLVLPIARTRPFPIQVQQLHLTDCKLPCLSGITVGQTTFDSARQRIRATFGATGYAEHQHIPSIEGFSSWERRIAGRARSVLQIHAQQGTVVTSMTLDGDNAADDEWMPSLGEALLIFGFPTCFIASGGDREELVYQDKIGREQPILFITTLTGLNLTGPIFEIALESNRVGGGCEKPNGFAWHGFTSRLPIP